MKVRPLWGNPTWNPQTAIGAKRFNMQHKIRIHPGYCKVFNAHAPVIHPGGWQPKWPAAYPATTYKWFILKSELFYFTSWEYLFQSYNKETCRTLALFPQWMHCGKTLLHQHHPLSQPRYDHINLVWRMFPLQKMHQKMFEGLLLVWHLVCK